MVVDVFLLGLVSVLGQESEQVSDVQADQNSLAIRGIITEIVICDSIHDEPGGSSLPEAVVFYSGPLVLFPISCYARLLPLMSAFTCLLMSGSSTDCQNATFPDSLILSAHV